MQKDILEKFIWEDNDFEQMGWHDNKIYAMAFDDERFELILDIDYIVKWVNPNEGDEYYKFYIAPATVIFKRVHDINISLYSLDLNIENIYRRNPVKVPNEVTKDVVEYDWKIEINNGEINFKSIGYRQCFRSEPILLEQQKIGLAGRGGVSFEVRR